MSSATDRGGEHPPAPDLGDGPRLAPASVLVVDDERFFREAIRDILVDAGFPCVEAADGAEALRSAEDDAIGVAVLDIRLPDIDGIEVLSQLRELRPDLRAIMLSASTDQELVLEALRLGACDYLAKPLHDEELVLAVRRAAEIYGVEHGRRQLQDRLARLAEGVERLSERVRDAEPDAREMALRLGAAETAADVLEAARTSLMLLDDAGRELWVAAAVGSDVEPDAMDAVPVGAGVAGLAFEQSAPLVVADVAADPRFGDRPEGRYASESFAVAPIPGREGALGVLCATDRGGRDGFGDEDAVLLRLLARQIAELMAAGTEPVAAAASADPEITMPVDLPTATPDAAEVDFDAELARQVCDAVVREVEPDRVLRAALEPVGEGLPAAPVSIYLVDGASGELRLEREWDGATRSDRPTLPRSVGLTGVVLQTGHLVAAEHPESDARFRADVDTPADGRPGPLLCVPLRLRGKVVGVARAFLEERGGGAHGKPVVSARTGEVLSAALSAAVRNVLLYRSLVESIEEVAEARRQAQPAR